MKTETKPRLIDEVKTIILGFPPRYYFSLKNISDKLDAAGVEYNKGGLKGGVLPTLIRQKVIYKDIDKEGFVRYRRVITQKPEPEKKRRKKYTFKHPKMSSTLVALLAANRWVSTADMSQILAGAKVKGSDRLTLNYVLRSYAIKGWVEKRKNTQRDNNPIEFRPTPLLWSQARPVKRKIMAHAPALAADIEAGFAASGRQSDGGKKQMPGQEEAPETATDLNQAIDWDLPENYFTAADLGAAMFEYMRRLNRQLDKAPKGQEAEKMIARLQYDLEEAKHVCFTRTRQMQGLERENKRLAERLETILEENKELKTENNNMSIQLERGEGRRPKSSFKLADVARIKKMAQGDQEVIDGSTRVSAVG